MIWVILAFPGSQAQYLPTLRGEISSQLSTYFVPGDRHEGEALYVTFPRGISLLKDGLWMEGVKISFGKAKEVEALYPTGAKFNYLRGKDPTKWRRNVPGFRAVAYREVYPGIDLVITGKGKGTLEFQWVVKPGADPGRIAIGLEGGEFRMRDGELYVVRDGQEVIRISPPKAYQGSEEVEVGQVLTGKVLRYRLGKYDPTHTLVIDPDLSSLAASTFLGGSMDDYINAVAVDNSGNVYVAGGTSSSDFPTTPGAYDNSLSDSADAFVAVFSPDLSSLLGATFLGGNSADHINALAVDNSGNIVVAGYTFSSDFPTTFGAYDNTLDGYSSAFVSVLSSDLSSLLHSTFLGGTEGDGIYAVKIDALGNVVVAGRTTSPDFPATSGAYDDTHNGSVDAFVSVLNPDLSSLLQATFLGGSAWDYTTSMELDNSGNVVVTGYTSSSDFPTTSGAYDGSYNGGTYDAFVSIFGTITSVAERPSERAYDYTLEEDLLKITLKEPAYVGLNIYSADGHLVGRITAGYLPAGRHTLKLPDLPSGTYSIRMRIGEEIHTFKVVGRR